MSNKISNMALTLCKMGQGKETCRYLTFGDGYECAKHTELRPYIDERVEAGTMTAQGDNCVGYK